MSSAVLLAASMVVGQADAEKAFNSFTRFALGGVWTTTIEDEKLESSYRRIADGRFVQITEKGGRFPGVGMIGIDPETKMCTWWVFCNDGTVVKFTMNQESDASWLCEGGATGPQGRIRWKFRISRLDGDTIKEEGIEFEQDGKKQEPRSFTWTRTRPAAKK